MTDRIFTTPRTRFALVYQLSLLALTGFAVLRITFFIRVWPLMDHRFLELIYIFGMGLIFDIAFISYFSIPFIFLLLILPNKWLNHSIFKGICLLTIFSILYGLFFNMVAEWLFWSEFGVRFNFISVDYLIYSDEVIENILESYPVFPILTMLFILTSLVFIWIRKGSLTAASTFEPFYKRTKVAFCLLIIPAAAVLFLNQPCRNLSVNNYVNELASNGPYQLFAAFRNNRLDYRQFYTTGSDKVLSNSLKQQISQNIPPYPDKGLYNIKRHIDTQGSPRKFNVILITVESLSAKFLTRFKNQQNITPFMDQWFKQGLLFTNFYATGTRTVRGLEAITLSIPPTPGRSVIKRPDNGNMYSLGKVFKDNGYDVAFLYGGRGYFDNMNSFFSKNGYRIVDQTRIQDKDISFKNAWGVCDEDLYNRTIFEANKADAAKQPFFFHIMTTSNHRPFTFPLGKIDLPPGEGMGQNGRAGGVKYTDYALSQLIKRSKKYSWFDNTVFIVVADHCAASAGKIGLPLPKYHIPLFMYAPQLIKPGEVHRLSSQIDIAPTLLSLLNFSYDSYFFGRDILSPDFKGRALIANYQKLGFYTGQELLILSPVKKINTVNLMADEAVIKKIDAAYPFVKEMMAVYQGADYILQHQMNRWHEKINFASK